MLQLKSHLYMLPTEIFEEIFKEKSCIWIIVELSSGNIQVCQHDGFHLSETIKHEAL